MKLLTVVGNTKTMTDIEIEQFLKSSMLDELETTITTQSNTYVNKEHLKFTIGIVRREISNSGLTLDDVMEILATKRKALISFGQSILRETMGKPLVEDYPKGEEPKRNEKSLVEKSFGIGLGFAIKYAIYLDLLERKDQGQLVNYLQKEKIPKANSFAKTLQRLYSS